MKIHLLDVYKTPAISGIFNSMKQNERLSEFLSKIHIYDTESIDIDYYYNRSGNKTISTFLQYMISAKIEIIRLIRTNDDYVVDSEGRRLYVNTILNEVNAQIINNVIIQKYLPRWEKIYDTFVTSFDATNPFYTKVVNKFSDNLNSSRHNENVETNHNQFDTTNNIDKSSNINATSSNEGTDEDSVFGFNSTESTPSKVNKQNASSTENSNTTDNSNSTSNGTSDNNINGTNDTQYNSERNSNTDTERKGNIGNFTITKLLSEAMEYYKYNILDTMFADIDNILTRSAY